MRVVRLLSAAAVLLAIAVAVPTQAQAQDTKPTVVPHDLEGKDNCLMCHSGKMPNVAAAPESHKDFANTQCMLCHSADSPMQTAAPPAIPHDLEGTRRTARSATRPAADAGSHSGRSLALALAWCGGRCV
jgi:hypothetical protein